MGVLTLGSGCARNGGWGEPLRHRIFDMQVQFYSPVGSTVSLRAATDGSAKIPPMSKGSHRLESGVETAAIYNLPPGKYAFAYEGAPGAQDATIYGWLSIEAPQHEATQRFYEHAFLPIKLLSEARQIQEHLFPSRTCLTRRAWRTLNSGISNKGT